MQSTSLGQGSRVFQRLLKIIAMLNQLSALRLHGPDFFSRLLPCGTTITTFNPSCDAASATPCPVIAARCRDHSYNRWLTLLQPVQINSRARAA